MSPFSMSFVTGFAELLTTALIHFAWQGAILVLMLLVILRLFDVKAARTRYLLSVGALLLMALAPVVTASWVTAIGHLRGDAQSRHSVAEASGQPQPSIDETPEVDTSVVGVPKEELEPAASWSPSFEVCLLFAWLVGVFVLSTRLAVGFGISLWIRTKLEPLSEELEQRVRLLGNRLRVNASKRVFASMRVCQAVAVGFVRPVVLVPVSWLTQLTPQMLEAIIAHELAHIRRWDLWVNLLQRLIETLLFYHPAVWWLSSRIRLEREMCCDEMAAECCDRVLYVRSLESVAKMAQGDLLLATSIKGGTKMNLLTRIRNLLGLAPADAAGNWWAVGLIAIILPFAGAIAISLTAVVPPSVAAPSVATVGSDSDGSQPKEKIVAAKIQPKAVTVTEQYHCKINAHRHIEIRALTKGFVETVPISEGQQVKQDDLLFAIGSTVCQAKLDAVKVELKVAHNEYTYAKNLIKSGAASSSDLAQREAKLAKVQADAALAEAELKFTRIKAPFEGIVGSLRQQVGGLVLEGDVLTTLSDNSALWVYFNVPESRYLEYMMEQSKQKEEPKIEIILANGKKFNQVGKIKAIDSGFNNATGTIPFRADFPNPDRLLRHGQSGKVLISRVVKDAVVIPKSATFSLPKQEEYVFVVDKDDVAHQRLIEIQNELADAYVIKSGVEPGEKIILEGIEQVRDGKKVKYEVRGR